MSNAPDADKLFKITIEDDKTCTVSSFYFEPEAFFCVKGLTPEQAAACKTMAAAAYGHAFDHGRDSMRSSIQKLLHTL